MDKIALVVLTSLTLAACATPVQTAGMTAGAIGGAVVIVPGLRHFYRRFAPGRLYDVPVKLGLRDRPLKENELNPVHPHT